MFSLENLLENRLNSISACVVDLSSGTTALKTLLKILPNLPRVKPSYLYILKHNITCPLNLSSTVLLKQISLLSCSAVTARQEFHLVDTTAMAAHVCLTHQCDIYAVYI